MKRHTLFLSLATVAALVLSACSITIEPGGPPPRQPDDTRIARNDPNNPVNTYRLQPGADVLVRVNVETTNSVLYLELNQSVDLEVFGSTRSRIASSSLNAFFAGGSAGLTAANIVEPQAINTEIQCRGSCVILDQGTSPHYFVLITNTSATTLDVGLFAFGDAFMDLNEGSPGNDVRASAPFLDTSTGDTGAIEVLGDVDFWRISNLAPITTLTFQPRNSVLGISLRVLDSNGEQQGNVITSGTFTVFPGDFIEVWSATNRAGSANASFYRILRP